MNGKVKTYKPDKGFGFILGEDGNDYFFHISNLKTVAVISYGDNAEFVPSSNDKGLQALEVVISPSVNNAKFITIGNKRHKISNIKEYGISTQTFGCLNVYRRVKNDNSILKAFVAGSYDFTPTGKYILYESYPDSSRARKHYYDQNGDIAVDGSYYDDRVEVKLRYLYIKNYQGDNDIYYEGRKNGKIIGYGDNVDLDAICKELDRLS